MFFEVFQVVVVVFDVFNEEVGFDGCIIDYKMFDDKGDFVMVIVFVCEFVGSDGVVVLVGFVSLIECEINVKYYEQEGIFFMFGIGVDMGCFDSDNIFFVNVGFFNDMIFMLQYGFEVFGFDDICILFEIVGFMCLIYQVVIDKWIEIIGKELKYVDDIVLYGVFDYMFYIVKVCDQGCKVLVINLVEFDVIGQVKVVNVQGWDDVIWLYFISVYSENFVQVIDDVGVGIYVFVEFYLFMDDSEINVDWCELMEKNDIVFILFSQGGYFVVIYFIEVFKSIDGDIIRESVFVVLKDMDLIENLMVGMLYVFGIQNIVGWLIILKFGMYVWEQVVDDWLCIGE